MIPVFRTLGFRIYGLGALGFSYETTTFLVTTSRKGELAQSCCEYLHVNGAIQQPADFGVIHYNKEVVSNCFAKPQALNPKS